MQEQNRFVDGDIGRCFCGCPESISGPVFESRWGPVALLHCRSCGAWRAAKVPNSQQLAELYSDEIYKIPTEAEFEQAQKRFLPVLKDLRSLGLEHGAMLDVGCDSGYALALFGEAGWSGAGVERNPDCRGYAQRVVGLPVAPDLESLPAGMQFDVALLSHVIEHIPDPIDFLKRVTARVRDGGYVYIKVPNYGSWTVRHVVKDRWDGFLPLQHIWYFDRDSLRGLAERTGHREVRQYTRARMPFGGRNLLWTVGKLPFAILSRLIPYDGCELVGIFRKS